MDAKKLKITGTIIMALIVVGAAFAFGVAVGYQNTPDIDRVLGVLNKTNDSQFKEVDFSPFWRTWRLLEEKYVNKGEIDRQKLVWGAISGLVSGVGDPYTVFFPPKETKDFDVEVKGEFSGIGAEIGIRKGVLVIIAPLSGSPAEKSGLKAGDQIIKIDDVMTGDLNLDEAVHMIRGERSTNVVLTIFREGDDSTKEITVTRDHIIIPVVVTEKRDNGIFMIRISSFTDKMPDEFLKAVREMLNSGSRKLVLDLRNNPGGYFDSAVQVASFFLPEGEIVAKEVFSNGDEENYRSYGYKALEQVPTVVLVNRGSASASEILAGALQEHNKAVLIGEKTFGKGSVQQIEQITGDTTLKVTIARWLTPNGKTLSKGGLEPDIEQGIPDDTKEGQDPQLDRAIKYLLTGE